VTNITFPEPENTPLCHPFSGHGRRDQPRTGVGDLESPVVYVVGVSPGLSFFTWPGSSMGRFSP